VIPKIERSSQALPHVTSGDQHHIGVWLLADGFTRFAKISHWRNKKSFGTL
jgi:hypothetical protein